MLEIIESTDRNKIIASLKEFGIKGAHFTNGTYAYEAIHILPDMLTFFRHLLSIHPDLPLIIAVNSDVSMQKLGKHGMEKQMVRARKVAVPLAETFPNNKVIVIFYDETTPNMLYATLRVALKQGHEQDDQIWTLHKGGYGTTPDAPRIEGAVFFDFVYAYPLSGDIKPLCWNETRRADIAQNIQVVDLRGYIAADGVLFKLPPSLSQYQSSLLSEEKSLDSGGPKASHFFDSRMKEESVSGNSWRYGRNNVFSPKKDAEVSAEAVVNTTRILRERGISECPAVMLESQYGKGISVVTESFLSDKHHDRDPFGRIIIRGDGLFTTLPDVVLLNKSGDAHAVILESKKAAGIFVGSWHCILKGIIPHMMEHFLAEGVNPNEITLHIGPGLGAKSYSVGQEVYDRFAAENPAWLATLSLKNNGLPGKSGKIKYLFDFPGFLRMVAADYGIHSVVTDESKNTFDKPAWKAVKAEAVESGDPKKLKICYADREHFSARFFSRVVRQIGRICAAKGLDLPEGVPKEVDYADTGRNLNGVYLRR